MSLFRDAQLTGKQIIMTTVLVAGVFVSVLNQTIVSPALPGIMSELGVDVSLGQWLITVYMLVMAVMIPVTAYLIDRFSIRTLFLSAMVLFTIGSSLLAWGPEFSVLILGRILQAVSSGMLIPMIMSILMWIFPIGFRGRAMGLYSLVVACAPAIGPTYSGVMVDAFSWHFVFLTIVVLAVIMIITGFFAIDDFGERKDVKLDKLSVILSSVGFGSLLFGCSIIGMAGGVSPESLIAIAAGIFVILWFGKRQLGLSRPLLELRVLRNRNFLSAVFILMLFQAGILVLSITMPVYIQTILGYSATMTGLVFLPGALFMAGMSMVSGRLFDRYGPRKPTLLGAAALMTAFMCFVFLDTGTPIWILFIIYIILSAGFGLVNTPLSTWALNSLDDKEIHHGSAVLNTLRQAAGAIGTALLVTVMSIAMSAYPDPDSIAANMAGFHATSVCMAAIMIVIFVVSFILVGDNKKRGYDSI